MNSTSAQLLKSFERATVQLKFCPNRVWAVAGEDLPNLLPHIDLETHKDHIDENKHELCTFDFCEYSRRDFTSVPQRCECGTEYCRQIGHKFPRRILDEAARNGKSTAWKLTGHSMLESPRPFMAVSHVWSDGTGAGSWREGEVNECLYGFFRDIAEEFECEGIWWDTICIPREKAARTQAIRRMHINYQDARITLVHDLFLRNWEWDPKTACFAILMSPWFSRGWTALELAQSPKVKIIFKGPQGPIVKDLDEEILAKEDGDEELDDEHEMRRRRASQIIRNLRRKITSVNELLTVLASRYTSWPKDLSVISALLVGIEPHESQQNTYMRIVRKLAKVSPGHLFHNAATMSGGSSWCPTSLFSMPLDNHPQTSLGFSHTGIEGKWRILPMERALERNFTWTGSHPLIRHQIQDALKKYPGQCSLLAECGSELAERALLVRILSDTRDTRQPIHCQYVGAIHLRNEMKFEKVDKLVIVHSDSVTSEQKEQEPTTLEKKTSEALRQAIWRSDYAVFTELVGQVDLNDPDELGRRPLHLAAERGQEQMVRDLVHFGAVLNTRSHNGQTVFHHAAWGGSVQIVEFLKERVDEMARDKNGNMALHIAAYLGFSSVAKILINDHTIDAHGSNNLTPLHFASMNGNIELISLLKNSNITSKDSKFGWTPLHCAADSGDQHSVKLLVDRGAQVDIQDHRIGWTPLHFAAINGHAGVVDTLICHAANINVEDKYGWTSLQFAEANEHAEVAQLLKCNGAHVPARAADSEDSVLPYGDSWTLQHCMALNDQKGLIKRLFTTDSEISFDMSAAYAPIQLAAENGLETTIRKLLRSGANSITALAGEGDTPIHWAARNGYETLTRVLLNSNASIDREAKDHDSRTPLHCASAKGHEAIVHLLLEMDVDKEAKTSSGQTPLHLAAEEGHDAIMLLLLELGANKEAQTNLRETPLHCAVKRKQKAAIYLLLKAGADIEAKCDVPGSLGDVHGPLQLAAYKGHEDIVRLLLDAGADKDVRGGLGGFNFPRTTPLFLATYKEHEATVRILLEAGADKEGKDLHTSETALHCAVGHGREALVRLLLEAGADKEAKAYNGATPLHRAVDSFSGDVAILPILHLLIDAGADMDAKDEYDRTPLYMAVKKGREPTACLLLKMGVNKETKSRIGTTPLHEAAYTGHEAIVRLLVEMGADKEAKDNDGATALHKAAYRGHWAIVRLLLDTGIDKQPKDNDGRSPLHHAVGKRAFWLVDPVGKTWPERKIDPASEAHLTTIRLLLEAGVEKDMKATDGRTALQEAVAAGHEPFVALLQGVDASRLQG